MCIRDRIIRVNADNLIRLALFDSDLAFEMLALSSARCRQGNQLNIVLLDSIQALYEGNCSQLQKCLNQLETEAGGFQGAAKQLASINGRQFKPSSTNRSLWSFCFSWQSNSIFSSSLNRYFYLFTE